jgi:GntR family transcriptional regulator
MLNEETAPSQIKTVDRFNQEKLYIQLTRIFLDGITSGKWVLDQKIPSEDELCRQYHVSKITVRQAINYLVSDGYLMKIQGKGTFVTSTTPVIGAAMRTRLTEEMFGKEVNEQREILQRGIASPSEEVKAYLRTGDQIYHLLARRNVKGTPAYLDESFIPSVMLPGIESIDFTNQSLFALLQEKGIRKVFKVIQTIEVMAMPGGLAVHLDLEEGAPVLAVHRLLLSSDETPVGYTRFLGRTDRYKLQTEFERIH